MYKHHTQPQLVLQLSLFSPQQLDNSGTLPDHAALAVLWQQNLVA
jgi:hypothetical protein